MITLRIWPRASPARNSLHKGTPRKRLNKQVGVVVRRGATPQHTNTANTAPLFTINLSKYVLTETDRKLLDRGLTFVPTYKKQSLKDLYSLQRRLTRNLKLKDYFRNKTTEEFDYNERTFTNKSSWTPADRKISEETLETVQEIISATERTLKELTFSPDNEKVFLPYVKNNLPAAERRALASLRWHPDIVIKPADKGSAVVILDKENYKREAYRQLNNVKYYKKLDGPIWPNNVEPINNILEQLLELKFISEKQYDYLAARPTDRERRFYLLPKIHKPKEKWPFPDCPDCRPIVSNTGSESYRVAAYIDSFVRPASINHPAFIKDTYDFVSKVRNTVVPRGALLVTADITSLYTNMSIDRMIETIKQSFIEHPNPNRSDAHILQLIEITLKNNDFTFNDEWFLQVCGTAMGVAYAPGAADSYLKEFDKKATCDYKQKPLVYFRYIDDVFLVWLGTVAELLEFQDFCNSLIPGITVNFEFSTTHVNFLDTIVYLEDVENDPTHQTLQTKVFFKPTDTHQLLDKTSFHPRHTFNGVLKSQFLRFKRICSRKEDFDEASRILMTALSKRNYTKRTMRRIKLEVWNTPTVIKDKKQQQEILPIIVPHNPIGRKLATEWRAAIQENENLVTFKPITAYTIGKNLQQCLVRSLLQPPPPPTLPPSTRKITDFFQPTTNRNIVKGNNHGCFRCNAANCKACVSIHETKQITSYVNGKQFKIRGRIDCSTFNIIYLISCRRCHKQYIGETCRTLRQRLTDHRSNIRLRKPTPITQHFTLPKHDVDDLEITGVHVFTGRNDKAYRRVMEATWQDLLQTAAPLGINCLQNKKKH
jgi:hypothetical protein